MTWQTPHSVPMMIFAAVFYGVCSGSMNFINKILMTSYSFPYPGVMILAQLTILGVALRCLHSLGSIKLKPWGLETARTCLLQSLLYSANTIMALFALNGMNVPMYNAMRRCIPFVSMLIGYLVFTKKPTRSSCCAVIVITVGAIIAASGDLTFDLNSYLMGMLSVVLMALNLTAIQYNSTETLFSTHDLLYINAVNCIPIMFLVCIVTEKEVATFQHFHEVGFIFTFLLVIVSGSLLNYSMFLCTTVNSALTTTCVGVLKSVVTTILGMYVLGGVTPTAPFLTGQALNFLGGVFYAYSKYMSQLEKTLPS